MRFWNIKNADTDAPEVRIDGEIHMEQDFWDWLLGKPDTSAPKVRTEIKKLDGKDITVWINSPGGDVVAASVIYTALKEHKGKVTVKVDGAAISAASVISMAGDTVLMSPTSVMMIHNPLTSVVGEEKDMEHAAEILREVKETIVNAYVKKTGRSREKVAQMMDAETWMGAAKAIENGFADGMLYEDKNPDVTNVMGARLVYNSLAHRAVDMERMREAIAEMNKDGKDESENAGSANDSERAAFQYAECTLSIEKAKRRVTAE